VASAELAERARTVAAAYEAEHGRPISRDALRRALHVSNGVAGELLRAVRAPSPSSVPVPSADGTPARTTPPAAGPTTAEAVPVPAPGPAAGNGRRPAPEDQPVPPSPSGSSAARVP